MKVVLYVDVASRPNGPETDLPIGTCAVQFLIPLPKHGQLRALSDGIEHVVKSGYFRWIHLPDVTGNVEAAQEQANTESFDLELENQAKQARDEKVRREIFGLRKFSRPTPDIHRFISTPTRLQNPHPDEVTPWAAWRKPNTTFLFYGLRDGSGWIVITHLDGRLVAVPWPNFDGWDESLPQRLGRADLSLGGVPARGRGAGYAEYPLKTDCGP